MQRATHPGAERDFLVLGDLQPGEFEQLLLRAEELRLLRALGTPHATRPGHVLALLFEKASTRTRTSFEVASFDLGGHALVLTVESSQLGRGEPLRDTARVLSGYCHAIAFRTFGQERAQELAHFASIPVINALTDLHHPCQLLADLQTVLGHFSRARGTEDQPGTGLAAIDVGATLGSVRYAWIGDGNNMANSWIEAAGLLGLDLAIACPEGYAPDESILSQARTNPRARIHVTRDPREAVHGRHVVSTDVFTSMGQEQESEARRRIFQNYIVDEALMKEADGRAVVLHCLPAHRGEEIAESVLEGPQSLVWKQAENRLHAQKALLEMLLG